MRDVVTGHPLNVPTSPSRTCESYESRFRQSTYTPKAISQDYLGCPDLFRRLSGAVLCKRQFKQETHVTRKDNINPFAHLEAVVRSFA